MEDVVRLEQVLFLLVLYVAYVAHQVKEGSMRKLIKEVCVRIWEYGELPREDRELLLRALKARRRAVAPNSGYHVGTAIYSSNGAVYLGANIEARGSCSSTKHAEQRALGTMLFAEGGEASPKTIAVVAGSAHRRIVLPPLQVDEPVEDIDNVAGPCGRCRQAIWDFSSILGDGGRRADPSVRILILLPNGEVAETTMGDLFPMPFGSHTVFRDGG